MIRLLSYLLIRLIDRRDGVFRYHDGRRWRAADPFAVHRSLVTHPRFDWQADVRQAAAEGMNPEEREFEASMRAIEAVREVFGIDPFAAGGLTDEGCVNLLGDYEDFCSVQKKSGSPIPTSPPATEPPSSAVASPAPQDSGST